MAARSVAAAASGSVRTPSVKARKRCTTRVSGANTLPGMAANAASRASLPQASRSSALQQATAAASRSAGARFHQRLRLPQLGNAVIHEQVPQ